MHFKRQIIIFIVIIIIGSTLGLLGIIDFNSTGKVMYFWPGTVIQSLSGILFGMIGVVAATFFPVFSSAIRGVPVIKLIIWTVANFIQSFLPFLTKKYFKFDPYKFNKKSILCFIIGCALIPNLLGALIASCGYYFSHEIIDLKQYMLIALNWFKANIFVSIIFGLLLLKFFAPALKECKIYVETEVKTKL